MKCLICNDEFIGNCGLSQHVIKKHNISFLEYKLKYENFIIPKCCICKKENAEIRTGITFKKTCGNKQCIKINKSMASKKGWTSSVKLKMSISMKKAHEEGRANNWQDSKKYNNSSYPEIFFENIINQEFIDKNYKREFRFYQYSIDFAWIHKKIAIEIDGCQHELLENKSRDNKKDKLLIENGWKVLRIKWKDMFNNPRYYINIAKNFVDNNTINIDYNSIPEYNVEIDYFLLKDLLNKLDIKHLINTIQNSDIDFSKLGWVKEVAKIINKKPQKVNQWMKKYMPEFYENKCFKRKSSKMK